MSDDNNNKNFVKLPKLTTSNYSSYVVDMNSYMASVGIEKVYYANEIENYDDLEKIYDKLMSNSINDLGKKLLGQLKIQNGSSSSSTNSSTSSGGVKKEIITIGSHGDEIDKLDFTAINDDKDKIQLKSMFTKIRKAYGILHESLNEEIKAIVGPGVVKIGYA
jgi:hypothetical protein